MYTSLLSLQQTLRVHTGSDWFRLVQRFYLQMPELHLVFAAGVGTANREGQDLPFGKVIRKELLL